MNSIWGPILLLGAAVFALVPQVDAAQGYRIAAGADQDVTEFSTCRKVTNNLANDIFVPSNSNAEWQSFYNNPPSGVSVESCVSVTYVTISSNASNINLHTLAGSPGTAGNYIFTINAGVIINSTNTSNASVATGSWPATSSITLVNNGNIYGKGGNGAGGVYTATGNTGSPGGAALSLGYNSSINNSSGNIFGGGGGGGGGAEGRSTTTYRGGGGGGGGQGSTNSSGGPGGLSDFTGNPGTGGTTATPGTGGPGLAGSIYNSGAGGNGGGWGSSGANGVTTAAGSGGAGGAGGNAVNLNGYGVTWLGGNNASQVKGDVD